MNNLNEIIKQGQSARNILRRNNKIHTNAVSLAYKNIIDLINKNNEFKNNFTVNDIADFFRGNPFEKSVFQLTKDEFAEKFKKFLNSSLKEYVFYFRVDMAYKFVRDSCIGRGKIMKFADLPKKVKETIEENYAHENNRGYLQRLPLETYQQYRNENDYYIKIPVKSKGRDNSNQLALKDFIFSKSIFDFFTEHHYTEELVTSTVYLSTDKDDKIMSMYYGGFDSKSPYFSAFHVQYIPKINQILDHANKNDIEKNILHAIEVVGTTNSMPNVEVRFLFCLIAIENLLMADEKDYLRWQLSERVAFLLAENKFWLAHYKKISVDSSRFKKITQKFITRHVPESRKILFEKMKDLYDKRSTIAHTGGKNEKITEDDYNLANFLLLILTEKLLELNENGIIRYARSDTDDPKSLYSFIEKKKFKT